MMDAKPQRPSRPQPSFAQANTENMIPAIYALDQRHKSICAPNVKAVGDSLKHNVKRTAFGDVSNVLRSVPDTAIHGCKVNTTTVNNPSGTSAVCGKENPSQTAGFLAPAQRAKLSGFATAHAAAETNSTRASHGNTTVSAARSTAAVLNVEQQNENDRIAGTRAEAATIDTVFPAAALSVHQSNITKIKQSPRHHKSQPCLKSAVDYQAQKKILRRTQSRLPVDHPQPKDVIVFADHSTVNGHEADGQSESEFHDANTVPYVDAVEDIHSNTMLAALDTIIDSADADHDKVLIDTSLGLAEVAPQAHSRFCTVEEEQMQFLSEVPAVPAGGVTDAEELWDDDGDFYDEQGYTTAYSFRSLGDTTAGGLTTVVMPKVTAKIQNELDVARSIVESSLSPEEIDDEAWDISMVAEYGEDINNYMRELEAKMLPSPHYMDMQTEIQWSMRAVLMEWLIQVHARFNLLPETLFLTVNYIDRFLSSKIVSVNKLQLVGATAIFIAAKYEEIVCPSIQEIVYMVDGGYTADEILKAERFMLSMLGFELGWPGPMSFLRRISKADDYDLETRTLAKYFLEVTVMDERFVASPASFLAAGSHCLARLMLRKGDWSMAHTHYSGYAWSQLRPLANVIIHCCRDPRTHHAAVFEKYASNKFKKASLFVEEELRRGFSMPPPHMHRHQSSLTDSFTENLCGSIAPLRSNHIDILVQAQG